MNRPTALLALVLLAGPAVVGLDSCAPTAPEPVAVDPRPEPVAWLEDVKPILDRRCVVCHSCYNAPCQLKLGSYEGVDRGGSKAAVYDSTRLVHQTPTRLFVDARSTPGWRELGFHSVIDSSSEGASNDSILLHLLDAKRSQPVPRGEYRSEDVGLSCPATPGELGIFLTLHPERGMPFGLPALSEDEYQTLASWLAQGASGPTPSEQRALVAPSPAAAGHIARWEDFLNRADPKHAMTARYLYEHYFLAHLRFPDAGGEFYELVRSGTPPGRPISVIATVRPYDDPGVDSVYYRFRKIHSTIVHKTHMVVQLDDARLARIRDLFIETPWLEEPHRVGLGDELAANPFLVYAQIPPRSRYQFLLDNSEFILRTMIRGPVCKGQVALNVIHDHFWVMFLDPDADETVRHPAFLVAQADHLRLPTEQGSQEAVLKTFSNRYRDRYRKFHRAKLDLYAEVAPEGFGIDAIWKGERSSDAPVLTVYRHFDSASLHKGVLGDLPRTVWVIDYSQFERIYYALVAGFDVFGNVSHQVNVRRYMDYLRIEGELNFLEFMPVEKRLPMLRSWYLGDQAVENTAPDELESLRPTRVSYETADPKRELLERVVVEQLRPDVGVVFDRINYTWDGEETKMPNSFTTHEDVLDGFRALTAPGTGFIRHITDSEVNVLFVRVRDYGGTDRFFTIVINRWHDNVNSMFGEPDTLDPAKDTIDFLPGSIGSYPNYFFDVAAEEVPELFDLLANFDGSPRYLAKVERFGIDRADPRFWAVYDWFQARMIEADPVEGGLYDLNRYFPMAPESPTDGAEISER